MHISQRFLPEDFSQIIAQIHAIRFGTLVNHDGAAFDATPIPWVPVQQDDELFLYGHLSNANRQLEFMRRSSKSLLIFTGVNGYISPRGLPTPRSAPTWNYVAVHLYGQCELLDAQGTEDAVEKLVSAMENERENPWRTHEMESRREQLMRHVTGIRFHAARIEAKFKLGQNENDADFQAILGNLEAEGRDDLAQQMSAANTHRTT